MTSKRFEETTIRKISPTDDYAVDDRVVWECVSCKEIFDFVAVKDENKKPEFCPMCGRRNSDA
jgi:rubrerythrin